MSILAVDGDATQIVRREHIFPMSRAVNPTCNGALNRVSLTIVICDILSEAPFVKWDLGASRVEVRVTDRHYIISHGDAVLHRDVVQGLVPGEGRQLVAPSELIRQVERSNTPLL